MGNETAAGERLHATPPIDVIDAMFDAPREISAELLRTAHDRTLPRINALCRPVDPNTEAQLAEARITDISEPKLYTTAQDVEINLYVCKRIIGMGESAIERLGVLVSPPERTVYSSPILELTPYFLNAESVTMLNRGPRRNQHADLAAFLKVVEYFDGQPVFLSNPSDEATS